MPTYPERLETATVQAEAAAAKADAIAQGPASGPGSTVSTTNGTVKTMAKIVADADAALTAAVSALEESATASATSAANSATAANTSATNASNSASAAATSATNAANSATAANTSATNAATSATNAGNSASSASTSATNAATSATNAANSASAAATSATTASTQATNAAASASSASTSASAAATSASSASASAAQAANAVVAQFKGVVAPSAVPATSALAGDYYRMASSGNATNVTTPVANPSCTTGDWLVYGGTSGYWTRIPGGVVDEARALHGDLTRAERDALFFGRGQSGSHAVWSSTEHGIIGTNDFTIVLPVVDWWYSTSSNTGLWLANNANDGNYATGTAPNNLRVYFPTSGQVVIALHDAAPNADTATRAYVIAKAALYDVAANRPGLLIIKRVGGVLSLRLNTQAIALPVETVVGSPVSTWAGYMDTTYHRLGQVFNGSGYLGKLGVPLIYTFGLSDTECDQLVTQGPRSLPYRHGSFKNYAPAAAAGWTFAGNGITVTDYNLATDPDGIGLPAGASTSDPCIKVVRAGGSGQCVTFMPNVFRQGGPVWLGSGTVKLTSVVGSTNVSWGANDASLVAAVGANGQMAQPQNMTVAVADGWKPVSYLMAYVGTISGGGGFALATSSSNTDFVAYIHAPKARPLGLLFDGVVQPLPIVADAGPNRIGGRLVNRVDPITDKLSGTFVGQTSTNGNQQLYGGECVPLNAELEVWARSLSGTPTIDVGNVSGGAQVVSAAALTTTWKKLTLVGGSHVTTTRNLWVKSNTADIVETRVVARIL